jgi:pimeloyl-ACP methyl ester carboxylesterase
MNPIHQKLVIVFTSVLVLVSLTACGTTTPAAEASEIITVVEVTTEVVTIVIATETSALEPPTSTPLPTASPTPQPMETSTPIPTASRTPVTTVEYSTEVVSFTTEDDIDLEGIQFLSEGDTAVVFAHMAGENDQQNWVPFANQVARRGFTALTFNFRCYGNSGCGGKDSGAILLSRDLGAAIELLRAQGYEKIVCIGASMGGRGCINAAFEQELAGLVIVAGTGSSHPERQNLADFISPDMPKLFIVTENDSVQDRALTMTNLYESAPEPKLFKIYPGTAHGTELFKSKYGQDFQEILFDFLAGIR